MIIWRKWNAGDSQMLWFFLSEILKNIWNSFFGFSTCCVIFCVSFLFPLRNESISTVSGQKGFHLCCYHEWDRSRAVLWGRLQWVHKQEGGSPFQLCWPQMHMQISSPSAPASALGTAVQISSPRVSFDTRASRNHKSKIPDSALPSVYPLCDLRQFLEPRVSVFLSTKTKRLYCIF